MPRAWLPCHGPAAHCIAIQCPSASSPLVIIHHGVLRYSFQLPSPLLVTIQSLYRDLIFPVAMPCKSQYTAVYYDTNLAIKSLLSQYTKLYCNTVSPTAHSHFLATIHHVYCNTLPCLANLHTLYCNTP